MANREFSPNEQYCDENGTPYAGGLLYFYAAGTSTPLDTYSNQVLSVANPNPVVLDSAGRAGSVFLQNLPYKVVLKDVDLNQIWTEDPVYSSDYSTVAAFQVYFGNPNGHVAGTAGFGSVASSVVWDTLDNILYICTTTGTATTAAWTGISSTGITFSTGDAKLTLKNVADPGWILMDDGTIGNAGSGATTRANTDTLNLFTLLWNNVSNTYAPVSTGRGANALADFTSLKTITLTQQLGRALSVSGTGSGLTARTLGQTLGEETHTLIGNEMPVHTHTVVDPGHTHPITDPGHVHSIVDPGHVHTITDPTHNHTINDPTHNHSHSDPGHNHSINDPTHNHSHVDPGHTHTALAGGDHDHGGATSTLSIDHHHSTTSFSTLVNTSDGGGTAHTNLWSGTTGPNSGVMDANNPHSHTISASGTHTHAVDLETTSITNVSAATGITNNSATTGMTNVSAATGITNSAASTGITGANSNTTGITGAASHSTGISQANSSVTSITLANSGSGATHNNMQPSSFWNVMIKL